MSRIEEIDVDPVPVPAPAAKRFAAHGLVVTSPAGLLEDVLAGRPPSFQLELVQAGVQEAPTGVIQDPAGSAIGANVLTGGGASGAIYGAFPDLEPIPAIAKRAAVFNTSTGPGRRVLHSHAPQLTGNPDDDGDRGATLAQIANTYANAMIAVNARAAELGADGGLLNLVPVSASIYAGAFRNPTFQPKGHLDPSWTLTAIHLAAAALHQRGETPPKLAVYFYDRAVCAVAAAVLARL